MPRTTISSEALAGKQYLQSIFIATAMIGTLVFILAQGGSFLYRFWSDWIKQGIQIGAISSMMYLTYHGNRWARYAVSFFYLMAAGGWLIVARSVLRINPMGILIFLFLFLFALFCAIYIHQSTHIQAFYAYQQGLDEAYEEKIDEIGKDETD